MGIHLPGWLKAILQGGYEPQADEDQLYALADRYDACATYLCRDLPLELDAVGKNFGSAYQGEAGVALEGFLKRYAHDAKASGPAALGEGAKRTAEFLRAMGDTVVRTKRELWIIGLVSLATIVMGLGPLIPMLIRKLGQEGLKRLILELAKRLIQRKARELQAGKLAEMGAMTLRQRLPMLAQRWTPVVLGEVFDEVIPHEAAAVWGELTGQDRRVVIGADGRPTVTHNYDWRAAAMTATGAVIGVPIAHGVGLAFRHIPGSDTGLGQIASKFGNNFVTTPVTGMATSVLYGDGLHAPTLQDALIAGGHGLARNSTDSTTEGPLEQAGHWVGEKLVSGLSGGHPPSGPDGGGHPVSPPDPTPSPAAAEGAAPAATARGTTPQAAPAGLLGGAVGGVGGLAPAGQGSANANGQAANGGNARPANGTERELPGRREPGQQANARNAPPDGGGPDGDTDVAVDDTADATANQNAGGNRSAAPLDASTNNDPGTQGQHQAPSDQPNQHAQTDQPTNQTDESSLAGQADQAVNVEQADNTDQVEQPGVPVQAATPAALQPGTLPGLVGGAVMPAPTPPVPPAAPAPDADSTPDAGLLPATPGASFAMAGRDNVRMPDLPPGLRGSEAYQQLSAADRSRVVAGVFAVTNGDPALLEGIRPLLESPAFHALGPDGILAEVESWADLDTRPADGSISPAYNEVFGRSIEFGVEVPGAPAQERMPDLPASMDHATDVTDDLQPLPRKLSSAGNAGRVASLGPHAGAYQILRKTGGVWVVKLYPDTPAHRNDAEVELGGLQAAYRTGFGPAPYGLVTARIGNESYVGVAMEPALGGAIEAHTRGANPWATAARREAAKWRAAVTFDTVRQLDLFGRRLLAGGYSSRYHLQPFVDEHGTFRPIDLAHVVALQEDQEGREYWTAKHKQEFAYTRSQLLAAAVENARQNDLNPDGRSLLAAPAEAATEATTQATAAEAFDAEPVAQAAFDDLNLPGDVRDNVNLVVLPDQNAFHERYPHVERIPQPRRGRFEPRTDGTADVVVVADANPTRADVEETVRHEVGHLAFAAFSPAEQAELEETVDQVPDTPLIRQWREEIEQLYTDHREEELVARAYAQVMRDFGGVPSRLRTWLDGFVTGTFGRLCVRLKLITPEQLQAAQSRRDHDLAPLYGVLRTAIAGLEQRKRIHPENLGPQGDRASLGDNAESPQHKVERQIRRLLTGQRKPPHKQLPGYLRGVRRILPLDERTYLVRLASGFAFEVVVNAGQTPNDAPYWRTAHPEDNLAIVTLSSRLRSDRSVAETLDAAFAEVVEQLRPTDSDYDPVVLTNRVRHLLTDATSRFIAPPGVTAISRLDDWTYRVRFADGRSSEVTVVLGRLLEGERFRLRHTEDGTAVVTVSHRLDLGTESGVLRSALGLLASPAGREATDLSDEELAGYADAVLSDAAAQALSTTGIVRATRLSDDSWALTLPTGQTVEVGITFEPHDTGVPFCLFNHTAVHSAMLSLPRRPGGPEGMAARIRAALAMLVAEYPAISDRGGELVRWSRQAMDERTAQDEEGTIVRIAGDLYQVALNDGTAYQVAITAGRLKPGTDFEVTYEPSLGRAVVRLSQRMRVRPGDPSAPDTNRAHAALSRALDRLAREAAQAGGSPIDDSELPELPTGQGTFTILPDLGGAVTVDVTIEIFQGQSLYQVRFDPSHNRLHVVLSPVLTRQEGRYALRTIVGRINRGQVPKLPPAGELFGTHGRSDADPLRALAAAEAVLGSDGLAGQTGVTDITPIDPGHWRVTAGALEVEVALTSDWVADGAVADAAYVRGEDGRLRLRLTLSDLATQDEVDAVVRRQLSRLAALAEAADRTPGHRPPFSHTIQRSPEALDDELDALLPAIRALEPDQIRGRVEAILGGESGSNVGTIRSSRRLTDASWLITLDNGFPVVADISVGSLDIKEPYQLELRTGGRFAVTVSDTLTELQIAPTLVSAAVEMAEVLGNRPGVQAASASVSRWSHAQLTDPGSPVRRMLRELGVSEVTRLGEAAEATADTFRLRFTDGHVQDVIVVAGWVDGGSYSISRLDGSRTPVLTLSHELVGRAPENMGAPDYPAAALSQGLRNLLAGGEVAAQEDIEQYVEYVRQWWATRNRRLTAGEVAAITAQLLGHSAIGETAWDPGMLADAQEYMREVQADLARAADPVALESAIHQAYLQARIIAQLKRGFSALGGLTPAWQQQVVEELVARDQNGDPIRFTNADIWGPATNSALPERDRNCAEAARAHFLTRYGEPTAAAPPEGPDGVPFGAADLEIELGGRFQRLELDTGLERLEQALREAGHGATALLVLRQANDGPGHVVVAEYNDAPDTADHNRGVSYFDWERGGRVRGRDEAGRPRLARPDLAGATTLSAFVLDASGEVVPLTEADGTVLGRGADNMHAPTPSYAPDAAVYDAWIRDLSAALSRPDVDDLPLAGHTDPLQTIVDVRGEPLGELPRQSLESARAERQLDDAQRRLDEALADWNAARDADPTADLTWREEAVEAAAARVVQRRAEVAAQRASDAVLDAVHRVESVVTNGPAVRAAEAQLVAAQRRIDDARFVTPQLRLQLGRAQAALAAARATGRQAFLSLTGEDGSTHRVQVRNDRGRPRYLDSEGRSIDRGAVIRETRSGVVAVKALAMAADGTPLPFSWLPAGNQTDAFARIGGAALAGEAPADPALRRALENPSRLADAIPGVQRVERVGEALLRIKTKAGQDFLLAVRRGELPGLAAETRRVGNDDERIFVTTIAPHEQVAADRVDLFRDGPINDLLDVDLSLATTAEEIAVIAAMLDALAPATEALAAVTGQLEQWIHERQGLDRLETPLAGVREAIRSHDPAALRAAAGVLSDALPAERPEAVEAAIDRLATALRQAADGLDGEPALRPGFDVPARLGLADVRTVTAILLRRQRIDEPHQGGLDGRDQWQVDRMRARRLRDTLSAAGLGESMLHRDERFALLTAAGLDAVVDIATDRGTRPGLADKLPLTVDRRWVDDITPGLGAAVDESLIERIGPGTFRVHVEVDASFTVAVLLDGADIPAERPDADLVLWLEAPLVAANARPELAARLRRLVVAYRQAGGALDRMIELAEQQRTPLLTPRRLGGKARANPAFGLDDHAVVGWLRAFREDHPAPTYRDKRTLREFLYEKGLLRNSHDYDTKLAALAAVDPDVARYIENYNKVRSKPLRLLNEAGADVDRAAIPDFDATNLPALVDWLQQQGLPITLTGETVTVADPAGDIEVGFAFDAGLAPGSVQLTQGDNIRSYTGMLPAGIDQHWGEQAAIHLVYAAVARHTGDPEAVLETCRDAVLARIDHQIATAENRRIRRLLEGERTAYLAQLYLNDVELGTLPGVSRNDRKQARRLAGKLALDVEREFRAAIGRGEPAPTRVPPMGKYQTTTVMDQGGIGLVNAGVGVQFSGDQPAHASLAVAFSLAQAWSYAIQYERTDSGAEARERAQLEGGAKDQAQRADQLAGALEADLRQVLEPLLTGLLTSATTPGPASDPAGNDVWSARPHDLAAGTTSFKYQMTANLRLTAWMAAQSVVHVGFVNHQPELAITGATAAIAQLFLKTIADRLLVGSRVANRVGLAAVEAAAELRERRHGQESLTRRLVAGVSELAEQAGITLPSDVLRATRNELADYRWSRPVATRRPNIAMNYQQCLRSRLLDRFAPNLIGAAFGLSPWVGAPVAAALQLGSGIVNTWMGAAVDAYYNNRAENAMFRVANQQNAVAAISSRQQLDADLRAAFDSWWSALAGRPGAARPALPGERLPEGMVLPSSPASVMPTPLQAFGVTGVLPAIVEPAVQAALGMAAAQLSGQQGAWHQIGIAGTQTAVGSIAGPAGMWFLNKRRSELQAQQEFFRRLAPQVANDAAYRSAFRNLSGEGDEVNLAGSPESAAEPAEVSPEDVALFAEYVRQWWSTRNRQLSDDELAAIAGDLSEAGNGPGPSARADVEAELEAARERMRELQAALARAEDPAALEPILQEAYEQARLISRLRRHSVLDPRTPAPRWQQAVVEELVPRDADGNPLPFTDADVWGPAVNSALPRRDRNCAPAAFAHASTRYGRPRAAAAPIGRDGIPFAAADLEDEFGGRFQQLGDLEQLETALRSAGHGATAFLIYAGHVIVVEYNDADGIAADKRGVSYFDWEGGGRLSGRPGLAGATDLSAFVIDGDANAVPITDHAGQVLGRGRGNVRPPTAAYVRGPDAYVTWLRDLAGSLGSPAPVLRTVPAALAPLHVSWESAIADLGVQVGGLGSVLKALAPAQVGLGHAVVNLTRLPFGYLIDPDQFLVAQVDGLLVLLTPSAGAFQTEQERLAEEVTWSREASERSVRAYRDWLADHPEQRPDVIHIHDEWMTPAFVEVADEFGIPIVMTVHATEAGRNGGSLETQRGQGIHALEWELARSVDHIIVNSPAMRSEVAALFAVPADRITVVPNGVDLAGWAVEPGDRIQLRNEWNARQRAEWQLPADAPVLFFLGRLAEEKGVQDIIEALPEIQAAHPGTTVVVAGDGVHRGVLEARVAELGLSDDVVFVGKGLARDGTLQRLAMAADAAIMPSRYEPFGVVGLELMALGVPLVASDVIGYVVDGQSGLRYPAGNVQRLAGKVIDLLGDPALRDHLATVGRETASSETYQWTNVAQQTIDVYRGVEQHASRVPGEVWLPDQNAFDHVTVRITRADRAYEQLRIRLTDGRELAPTIDDDGAFWHVPFDPDSTEATVAVYDNGELLHQRTVEVSPGQSRNHVWFRDTPPANPVDESPLAGSVPSQPSQPSDWASSTVVTDDLHPLPSRMSSAGESGTIARLGDHAGAYLIQRPDGTRWVVKLYPDSPRYQRDAEAELDGLQAAARTGYGPTPYGLVRATIDERQYVGVAMAPVQGGFIVPKSEDPAAIAEAARWRSAVTYETVRQYEDYARRLLELGYRTSHETQGFVDSDGNFRPIDFQSVVPVPADSAAPRTATVDPVWRRIADPGWGELLDAAQENAQRQQQQQAPRPGLAEAEVESVAAEVRARLRVSEHVDVRVVPDLAGLEALGISPGRAVMGLYRNENGHHVVYLVADQLHSAQDVDETIRQELQHGGLRVLAREDHDRVLAWLLDQYDDPRIALLFGDLSPEQQVLLDRQQAGHGLTPAELTRLRELAEHAYIEFALTVPATGPMRARWHQFLANVLGPILGRSGVWSRSVGLAVLHDTARQIARAMRSEHAPRGNADADPHYRYVEAGPGLTAGQLYRALDSRRGGWPADVELGVVRNVGELVEATGAAVSDLVDGVYVGKSADGARTVVAMAGERYQSEQEALAAANRALLEHLGPRALRPQDWQRVLNRLATLRNDPIHPHLLARLDGSTDPEALFALLARRQPEALHGFWDTLLTETLRPALRAAGLTDVDPANAARWIGRGIDRARTPERPVRNHSGRPAPDVERAETDPAQDSGIQARLNRLEDQVSDQAPAPRRIWLSGTGTHAGDRTGEAFTHYLTPEQRQRVAAAVGVEAVTLQGSGRTEQTYVVRRSSGGTEYLATVRFAPSRERRPNHSWTTPAGDLEVVVDPRHDYERALAAAIARHEQRVRQEQGLPSHAVDAFLHRMFQRFAAQFDTLDGRTESGSRRKLLGERPLLRHLVQRHGADQAAALGRLDANDFEVWIDSEDRQAVADVFAQLSDLLAQRDQPGPWRLRRAAAREFADLATSLGLLRGDDGAGDLRAALPPEVSQAAAEIKPAWAERLHHFIENGVPSLPRIRSELIFAFVETAPPGLMSAAILAGNGRVGLAAAVLGGTALAWPARGVVNRFVDAADERAKAARRAYRTELEGNARSQVRAELVDTILRPYRQLLAAVSEQVGWHPADPRPRRAPLAPPEPSVPGWTAPWWTFPLRSAVPIFAAALPLAVVVPPLLAGATVGLAAAVAVGAEYGFGQLQARLDDKRRIRTNRENSWRQLVDDLRLAADALERLRTMGDELSARGLDLSVPDPGWDLTAPSDPANREVPPKTVFAVRELLISAIPIAQRSASIYIQHQLASAGAALLLALGSFGASAAVSGVVEALLAEANRYKFDRRVDNYVELMRRELQARSDRLDDSVFAQFDRVLERLRSERSEEESPGAVAELEDPRIPAEEEWKPILYPARRATARRRWYGIGALAIGGTGIGMATTMLHAFGLSPIYLKLAWVGAAWQPVSYYTKYLRRRSRVRGILNERERSKESTTALEFEQAQAARDYVSHHLGRFQDLLDGRQPRERPAPADGPLAGFIEDAYRDLDESPAGEVEAGYQQTPKLLRLVGELARLDGERVRLGRLVGRGEADIRLLSRNLLEISSTLSAYADAVHQHGLNPHVRMSGPAHTPASDSVLHHDPLHPRNLTDVTWASSGEHAALVIAKVEQLTEGRYRPLAASDIVARPGQRLIDVAAALVYELEAERAPWWQGRDTARARALRAKVDFLRALTGENAAAAPAPLSWLALTGQQVE